MNKPDVLTLRKVFAPLEHVDDEQLSFLITNSEHFILKQDDFLFRANEPVKYMHLLVSGNVKLYGLQNDKIREFVRLNKGDITSLLPYSRMESHVAFGQALEDCEILAFPREKMPDMIRDNYELTAALVHLMSNRIKFFTTSQLQNEKMVALGKLSAGLAHEMNNPASAIVRSSKGLLEHLKQQPDHFKKLMAVNLNEQQIDGITEILFSRINTHQNEKLSLMKRQLLEDDLADCLLDLKVDEAEQIAENLADFRFSCQDLEKISELSGGDFPMVMNWINQNITTENMVKEIEEAATRISELVSSVKSFTHMDRSQESSPIDLESGLESTLTMLNHKIRSHGISIERNYQDSLPKPMGNVGEINQVLTNLLDNAADALQETANPLIRLETGEKNGFAILSIEDNGPGIPEDIIDQIFEPFFTTKDIGEGTGMGLEVVKSIIEKHEGEINVESEPGKTRFIIKLPVN